MKFVLKNYDGSKFKYFFIYFTKKTTLDLKKYDFSTFNEKKIANVNFVLKSYECSTFRKKLDFRR